ncbi:amylo-alpha-1,6-glucosidase [Magnetospirillum sp. UT-4]|uniref:amylo-alpha-1,6-glucosidase n=1 Tax=Magnetospirillum sp. UT-4 TaxID=2681467 RepID=UPI00138592DF|nr:amylo-alpha-1,6-glucosidase [Magnetospirillum sp. UT-4]CAA7619680.1 MalQ [Magnetospirillum sp. UT-4]
MPDLIRRLHPTDPGSTEWPGPTEWIVANGLGGYATGLVAGGPIRRYHGWLVAALPPPLGRTMLFNHLEETVLAPGGHRLALGGEVLKLAEFRLEDGLPVWRFEGGGVVVERRLAMPWRRNETHLLWQILAGGDGDAGIELRPWLQPRPHGTPVDAPLPGPPRVAAEGGRVEIALGAMPPLRLALEGEAPSLDLGAGDRREWYYANEDDGGDPARGPLWSPGTLSVRFAGGAAALVASAEDSSSSTAATFAAERARRRALVARAHPALHDGAAAELVLAADAFVVTPRHRPDHDGDAARSIIAGYHWFTDWGRDTMISLEGLTLLTGRADEAAPILRSFAGHVRDGLIPNMFPDGAEQGLYNTADATLWFFHAVGRCVALTGDRALLTELLPVLSDIIEHHRRGTRFGIAVDPADGLLRQGADGLQLTWMDAKVGDWVVTPRRGKAVEINALWYNALALMAEWLEAAGDAAGAARAGADAARVRDSFNRRFWAPALGHLYDVVDGEGGDDATLRPNQLFALSLPNPVLEPAHWPAVAAAVRDRLLTPVGLRSLAPGHPDYKPRYVGDQWGRDGAYHQGTVWAWLIGPFIDAWLRAYPDDAEGARAVLSAMLPELDRFAVGTLGEVFDADPPHTPRGCIAQAWSVAEWLRAWVRAAEAQPG